MKKVLSLLAAISVSSSVLVAGVADIGYGSAAAAGGANFLNSTSVSLGYFDADTFSADLTGWNALATNSTDGVGTGWYYESLASLDTTAAEGSTAYLLFTTGSLNGFVTSASWDTFSGATPPATPPVLDYTIGASATAASLTTLAGTGATVTVTDGQGTDFAGGYNGDGVSFTLSAVPEPSSYALLGGLLALTCVMLRRRA